MRIRRKMVEFNKLLRKIAAQGKPGIDIEEWERNQASHQSTSKAKTQPQQTQTTPPNFSRTASTLVQRPAVSMARQPRKSTVQPGN